MRDVLIPGGLVGCARRIVLAGILAASLALLTVGCGAGQARVALPTKAPHVRATTAPHGRPSVRQRVLAAYQGYWQAASQAVQSRSTDRARAILARYIPRDAMSALITWLRGLWRRDETSYGRPVLHVMSVRISAHGTAAVHDCVDLSDTGLADWRTGRIVGVPGQSHENLITRLVLEHGRWLVAGEILVVQACSN